MNADWQRIAESKAAYRTKLSRLPFDEKVALLEQMRDRNKGIKRSRLGVPVTNNRERKT